MTQMTSLPTQQTTLGNMPAALGRHVSICLDRPSLHEREVVIYAGQDEENTRQFFRDYIHSQGAMSPLTDLTQVVLRNGKSLEGYAFK